MSKQKRGFTLIELLVVIAIIAVLMGILMPALNRVKKQAQNMTCRARLKQWGLMFKLYTDAHDGQFNQGWGVGETTLWMNALRPYYEDEWDMFRCPTAKTVAIDGSDWGTFKSWSRDVDTPGGGSRVFVGSYSINSWTNNVNGPRGDRPEAWFWKSTLKAVGPTNNIPVFADSTWMDAWARNTDTPPENPLDFGSGDKGTTGETSHFCIDRHQGVVNFVFMDWSVRGVGLKELWTLKWHRNSDIAGVWTDPMAQWPTWLAKY